MLQGQVSLNTNVSQINNTNNVNTASLSSNATSAIANNNILQAQNNVKSHEFSLTNTLGSNVLQNISPSLLTAKDNIYTTNVNNFHNLYMQNNEAIDVNDRLSLDIVFTSKITDELYTSLNDKNEVSTLKDIHKEFLSLVLSKDIDSAKDSSQKLESLLNNLHVKNDELKDLVLNIANNKVSTLLTLEQNKDEFLKASANSDFSNFTIKSINTNDSFVIGLASIDKDLTFNSYLNDNQNNLEQKDILANNALNSFSSDFNNSYTTFFNTNKDDVLLCFKLEQMSKEYKENIQDSLDKSLNINDVLNLKQDVVLSSAHSLSSDDIEALDNAFDAKLLSLVKDNVQTLNSELKNAINSSNLKDVLFNLGDLNNEEIKLLLDKDSNLAIKLITGSNDSFDLKNLDSFVQSLLKEDVNNNLNAFLKRNTALAKDFNALNRVDLLCSLHELSDVYKSLDSNLDLSDIDNLTTAKLADVANLYIKDNKANSTISLSLVNNILTLQKIKTNENVLSSTSLDSALQNLSDDFSKDRIKEHIDNLLFTNDKELLSTYRDINISSLQLRNRGFVSNLNSLNPNKDANLHSDNIRNIICKNLNLQTNTINSLDLNSLLQIYVKKNHNIVSSINNIAKDALDDISKVNTARDVFINSLNQGKYLNSLLEAQNLTTKSLSDIQGETLAYTFFSLNALLKDDVSLLTDYELKDFALSHDDMQNFDATLVKEALKNSTNKYTNMTFALLFERVASDLNLKHDELLSSLFNNNEDKKEILDVINSNLSIAHASFVDKKDALNNLAVLHVTNTSNKELQVNLDNFTTTSSNLKGVFNKLGSKTSSKEFIDDLKNLQSQTNEQDFKVHLKDFANKYLQDQNLAFADIVKMGKHSNMLDSSTHIKRAFVKARTEDSTKDKISLNYVDNFKNVHSMQLNQSTDNILLDKFEKNFTKDNINTVGLLNKQIQALDNLMSVESQHLNNLTKNEFIETALEITFIEACEAFNVKDKNELMTKYAFNNANDARILESNDLIKFIENSLVKFDINKDVALNLATKAVKDSFILSIKNRLQSELNARIDLNHLKDNISYVTSSQKREIIQKQDFIKIQRDASDIIANLEDDVMLSFDLSNSASFSLEIVPQLELSQKLSLGNNLVVSHNTIDNGDRETRISFSANLLSESGLSLGVQDVLNLSASLGLDGSHGISLNFKNDHDAATFLALTMSNNLTKEDLASIKSISTHNAFNANTNVSAEVDILSLLGIEESKVSLQSNFSIALGASLQKEHFLDKNVMTLSSNKEVNISLLSLDDKIKKVSDVIDLVGVNQKEDKLSRALTEVQNALNSNLYTDFSANVSSSLQVSSNLQNTKITNASIEHTIATDCKRPVLIYFLAKNKLDKTQIAQTLMRLDDMQEKGIEIATITIKSDYDKDILINKAPSFKSTYEIAFSENHSASEIVFTNKEELYNKEQSLNVNILNFEHTSSANKDKTYSYKLN